ncbi:hypothetical protein J4439_08040 [Candidatus Woesearchaeota archaeon]|nr:hypothetical protein [Candidatus Woesearchaeota archaeon]
MSRGFFSRVRGMLQSRQEAVILTPNSAIDRINDAERLLERKYDGTLRVLSERFCNESRKTKENITRLREGNLLNRNVEERHLHIMEGNRSAYIKKVEQFLEEVGSHQPSGNDTERETAALLREGLERLVKSTQKGYFILQEFLANESGAIAGNLKMFDSLITELKKEADAHEKLLCGFDAVRERLARLDKQPGREERLRREAEAAEKAAASAREDLEKYKRGASYEEYSLLSARLRELKSRCSGLVGGFSQRLGVIDRAMRKYSKMSAEPEIVEAVLIASVRVLLLEPERLERLLPLLERAIHSGELDLKDRKRERSLEIISSLKKELPALAKAFSGAEFQRQEADALLRGHPAWADEQRLGNSAEEALGRARLAGEAFRNCIASAGTAYGTEKKEMESEVSRLLGQAVCLSLGTGNPTLTVLPVC